MPNEPYEPPPRKTLWMYFGEGLRRANAARPVSFYLLVSIPIVLLLGVRLFRAPGTPQRFALYLTLFFIFFFVILHRAIVDFIEIARNHFHEQEKVFKSTLGDEEFATQLGERVQENLDK